MGKCPFFPGIVGHPIPLANPLKENSTQLNHQGVVGDHRKSSVFFSLSVSRPETCMGSGRFQCPYISRLQTMSHGGGCSRDGVGVPSGKASPGNHGPGQCRRPRPHWPNQRSSVQTRRADADTARRRSPLRRQGQPAQGVAPAPAPPPPIPLARQRATAGRAPPHLTMYGCVSRDPRPHRAVWALKRLPLRTQLRVQIQRLDICVAPPPRDIRTASTTLPWTCGKMPDPATHSTCPHHLPQVSPSWRTGPMLA